MTKFTFTRMIKSIALSATLFLSTFAMNVHAAFINFDDLTYIPEYVEMPDFSDTPLTNQYLSEGLLINDGYLMPYNFFNDPDYEIGPDHISGSNYLLGGNFLSLNFVGDLLPDFVGMYIGSGNGETIFLEAYGASGLISSTHTAGDGGPYSAPYTHKQYVSFEAGEGIKSINIWGFYNSRVSARIDDLTFTYSEVPEPSSIILFIMGTLAIFSRRMIKK